MSASQSYIHCQNCNFSHLCLPLALNTDEMDKLDTIVKRNNPLHKNDYLIESNTPLTSLYAVRTGSFKSYIEDDDGEYQITAFHFPGDIIGFDGLREKRHVSQTQALETAMVCEIPFHMLEDVAEKLPNLRNQLMKFMSAEIQQDRELVMLLNKRNAESRLLYFLISLSKRFEERGFSATSFLLPMTRTDIGNFLGLTVETVSRLLTRFQKNGLIKVEGKALEILKKGDMEQMLTDYHINIDSI
ncbi:fumarate/nitrate reduction transcriptional regulator Fnr [Alteromonas sediminis]|uniref:Fumarate/nitrate reduction transcriptional regulator Fnr n=1 Tax=Alteromonas sediminis TaxID=2259342 RepID=A0A3N5Y3K3_9ALTE|nr:fumarate/nitrate reduction transcriptional regulator Fnr [Alteromonas sediminis]RPJ67406.1 fumarate/nitrate reduction transcriptional regulator Fnr [Alteromonas sediminis]